MATDGPTPAPCQTDIYEKGKAVLITNSIPSNAMENWVKKVAKLSGQPVDWHFCGGRAVVLALGDLNKVMSALWLLREEHDALYLKELNSFGMGHCACPWNIQWNGYDM